MNTNLKECLAAWLENGFWFHRLVTIIRWAYLHLSLGYAFNRWLTRNGQAPEGASEAYQAVVLVVGITWLGFIESPVWWIFETRIARFAGSAIVLYRVTEVFVFALHWILAAEGRLGAIRRSLAGFVVNLCELAVWFPIAFLLVGCVASPIHKLRLAYDHLHAVWSLELANTSPGGLFCRVFSHYEIIVAGTLLLIVVASLVGGVLREEYRKTPNGMSGRGHE